MFSESTILSCNVRCSSISFGCDCVGGTNRGRGRVRVRAKSQLLLLLSPELLLLRFLSLLLLFMFASFLSLALATAKITPPPTATADDLSPALMPIRASSTAEAATTGDADDDDIAPRLLSCAADEEQEEVSREETVPAAATFSAVGVLCRMNIMSCCSGSCFVFLRCVTLKAIGDCPVCDRCEDCNQALSTSRNLKHLLVVLRVCSKVVIRSKLRCLVQMPSTACNTNPGQSKSCNGMMLLPPKLLSESEMLAQLGSEAA